MARRRFVLIRGDLVEVSPDYGAPLAADSGALWGDRSYANLRATDGTPIDTRTKHREYMKARNLTTMDDFKNQWARDGTRREMELGGYDPSRKQDIADVIYGRNKNGSPSRT